MAWTAPMTAVANTVFTAAQFNTHVRDNLLETAPAKATVAGRIFVTTGANAIAERIINEVTIGTAETTTSTTYTDLATVGPQDTRTTGTSAIVFVTARVENSGTNFGFVSCAVSGASTVAAADPDALILKSPVANDQQRASAAMLLSGLTAGSNTFTMQYRVSAGTGTFANRKQIVIPL